MPGAQSTLTSGSDVQESGILRPFLIGVFTMVALLLHAYAITNASDTSLHQITALFPHLYYIPIVLASIWYPRRGLLFICVLVGISIGMVLFGFANGIPFDPLILVYMSIYVWVVATTSVFTMEQWKNLSRFLISKKRARSAREGGDREAGDAMQDGQETGPGEDVDSLLATLAIQDSRVRKAAIASLGRSRDVRALSPLTDLLGDENRNIREASVRALGAFGDEAVESLTESLGNEDWHIRMGSAIALRIIGDSRGVDPLIRALSDENRFVRREAAKSLGRIGDKRATEPLISVLEDRDTGVRIRAAAALGKIADPKAIDPLTHALSDRNSELREAAVEALSKLKNSITSAN
ncbi:MAG: HEAT repeat domain-containing protein [Methanomicrobiales archaeon]|nr:HEAT repeat domain-containing protein [Methanomicrobiales archaeon]